LGSSPEPLVGRISDGVPLSIGHQEALVSRSLHAHETRTVRAVCAMLGVPESDWHLFATWASALVAGGPHDELDVYVDLMIADRCYRATDDLLNELIMTGVDGEDLMTEEIQLAVRAMLKLARQAEIATGRM
jgi:cytochrome P450